MHLDRLFRFIVLARSNATDEGERIPTGRTMLRKRTPDAQSFPPPGDVSPPPGDPVGSPFTGAGYRSNNPSNG